MQKSKSNGNLEQAMALLIQNQAAFVSQLHETSKHINEMRKYQVESDQRFAQMQIESEQRFARMQIEGEQRFARIENELDQIKAILAEHGRVLTGLPDVIRQKIGFKAK